MILSSPQQSDAGTTGPTQLILTQSPAGCRHTFRWNPTDDASFSDCRGKAPVPTGRLLKHQLTSDTSQTAQSRVQNQASLYFDWSTSLHQVTLSDCWSRDFGSLARGWGLSNCSCCLATSFPAPTPSLSLCELFSHRAIFTGSNYLLGDYTFVPNASTTQCSNRLLKRKQTATTH